MYGVPTQGGFETAFIKRRDEISVREKAPAAESRVGQQPNLERRTDPGGYRSPSGHPRATWSEPLLWLLRLLNGTRRWVKRAEVQAEPTLHKDETAQQLRRDGKRFTRRT